MWYDEVTPCVLSALLGISGTKLQGGSAYTTVQACPHGTVPSVKMIGLGTFDVSCGIHQTIGGSIGMDIMPLRLSTEAIGAPLAGIVPGLESVARLPKMDIYVLDEVVDLAGAV